MTVRKLQDDGDIATSGVQFLTDKEEIAQTIVTRLQLFLGEYFRDISEGTPWFQQVMIKNGSLDLKESAIKTRIIQTNGVTRLNSFEADFDINTRTYTIKAGVLTTFGETSIILADRLINNG